MKQQNALQHIDRTTSDSQHRCCLAHLRALLGTIRARHRFAESVNIGLDDGRELVPPSLRDYHVGELEASVLATDSSIRLDNPQSLLYNSPQELTRAKWVFAATLLVPILLMSALLIASGNVLDHSMISLLRFSIFLLAIPLTGIGVVRFFQTRASRQS